MNDQLRTMNYKLGIAFDIGTTTIVGSLIDLEKCKKIKTAFLPNPQIKWGRDVLSRVSACIENPQILKTLQNEVLTTCNGIIRNLINHEQVGFITIAGNSVMEHLLLGISPAPLAKVPYKPAFKEAKKIKASEIGITINPKGYIYTFPLIGGFVGGDTVAVVLAAGIHKSKEYSLAIDIGTNNEIVLAGEKGIWATSTAAGPAFEGGTIKHGMIAEDGAIQGMDIEDNKIKLDVIGNTTPKGICGSGIIDAIAKLLDAGIIDKTGRIKARDELYENIANRIVEQRLGVRGQGLGNAFLLYKDTKKEITITQNDVREIQLAKGAIQAGIKILLNKAKVGINNIEKVFIAGAFGSNIKKESLAQIGVIEKEWLDKVIFVGDAALEGAKLALCSEEKRNEAEEIAIQTKHLSLSGSAHFQEEFMKEMGF
ncbi:MAG TPA: metal-binding protein [Deltaproteobacteria bacterium]|nr:metal-binding protein [Deltaproteobacteria bacterium]